MLTDRETERDEPGNEGRSEKTSEGRRVGDKRRKMAENVKGRCYVCDTGVVYLLQCTQLKMVERERACMRTRQQEVRETKKWDSTRRPISRDNRAVTVF